MIMSKVIQGQLDRIPQMQQVKQMLAGKSPEQQWQTLLNFAKSQGIDTDSKIFSEADLKSFGLIK